MTFRMMATNLLALGLAFGVLAPFGLTQAANAQGEAGRTRAKTAQEAKKAAAKKDAAKKADAKKAEAKRNAPIRRPITAEQIARVEGFVKHNMPELSELLAVLKSAESTRYEQAIRELHAAAERLERMKPRDPDGHQLALQSWKLEKRLQLAAARIRMDDSSEGAAELKKLLQQRYQVEMKILARNRDRLEARLQKMDAEIARRRANHQDDIDRLVKNWTRGAAKQGTTPVSERRPKKPASRGNAKKGETKLKAKTNN